MADETAKLARTVHIRFRVPTADATQSLSMMIKASAPFMTALNNAKVRLLRNADDPTQFIQVIEYQADSTLEINRQKLASDPTLRVYLQTWRSLFPGGVEIDIFEDVTEGV
jgi:hypothetical protein